MTIVNDMARRSIDLTETRTRSFASGMVGLAVVGVALVSALMTFLVLEGLTSISPGDSVYGTFTVFDTLLLVNGVTVLFLLAIIGREVWQLLRARRRGRAGSRLHVQIVGLFSIIAALPAILIAVVASISLDRGLDRFFTLSPRAVIENSLNVTEAYLGEQMQMIGGDVVAMGNDISRTKPFIEQNPEAMRQLLTAQASLRRLAGAMLIDSNEKVIDKADVRVPNEFVFLAPDRQRLASTSETEPTMMLARNYVAAMIKLHGFEDTYLFVTRILDPLVVANLRQTQASIREYADNETRRLNVQIAFGLMYTVIALTVLLSAVWIGLNFANRLVEPIRRLIAAANVVSTGNLYVQVPIGKAQGDMAQLGATFNKMTQELRTQRDDIVRARDLVDSRRRFTEAVLSGASAGVIGIDSAGKIGILNRSAEKLIGCTETTALGRPLVDIVPELSEMVETARATPQRSVQGQVTITRAARERIITVRVTSEQSTGAEHGYVFTLDDITELVAAQRTSAWADVARRIAHEIKNPLTPIQLSAERLRRKYGSRIVEDKPIFEQCTDTIVRQVEDIRRMVDEFSRFARMPKAVISDDDLADTVRQVVFLQRVGNADIDIEATFSHDPMPARLDRRLISQALTNIIKNATEAIGAVPAAELGRGHITVTTTRDGNMINIDVIDNGIGLPKENRNRLTEPYVTTREKGTGLGLAIVGKILEEHGGGLELHDASEKVPGQRGSWIRLAFATADNTVSQPETELAS
ncbi:MAG: PAS domain-containing sensor histidine kinase [Xanthobacteraceae bacterium]|nr:PAS domain-containing sensor histidine kinase [Xanthobacteraceae bacterium]